VWCGSFVYAYEAPYHSWPVVALAEIDLCCLDVPILKASCLFFRLLLSLLLSLLLQFSHSQSLSLLFGVRLPPTLYYYSIIIYYLQHSATVPTSCKYLRALIVSKSPSFVRLFPYNLEMIGLTWVRQNCLEYRCNFITGLPGIGSAVVITVLVNYSWCFDCLGDVYTTLHC
jgi:hypothetical protein